MEKSFGREKRRYPRLMANFVISYKIKNIPNDYDLSQTKNVGQGGLLLTTNRKFPPGTQLTLTVKFPFVPQRMDLSATVVDSKEVVKNLLYDTRLSFADLNKKFFQELGEFVAKHLSQ